MKTDNPKLGTPAALAKPRAQSFEPVVQALSRVDASLKAALKGYRSAQYEQAQEIFQIATGIQKSLVNPEGLFRYLKVDAPKNHKDFAQVLRSVLRSINALNADRASMWLRAFKHLIDEGVSADGIAAALSEAGGFKKLASRQAAKKGAAPATSPLQTDDELGQPPPATKSRGGTNAPSRRSTPASTAKAKKSPEPTNVSGLRLAQVWFDAQSLELDDAGVGAILKFTATVQTWGHEFELEASKVKIVQPAQNQTLNDLYRL
jgi:hypothetical protein